MRRFGIKSNPGDLRLIALADQGVSVETMQAGCEYAKERKPNESIPAAYVFSILERWAREAADLAARGATPPAARAGALSQKFNFDGVDRSGDVAAMQASLASRGALAGDYDEDIPL